ncbi:MAG TPA: hypothetical protein VFY48_10195 [Solirubrobacterales bacterium]|nr:hypothetical protein [Solirubrobacterales bacterium]
MAFSSVFAAPAVYADTGDVIEKQNDPPTAADGFQAGTCTSDEPTKCSPDTPGLFYTTAGGHPAIGFTQYIVKHETIVPGVLEKTLAVPKTIRVDLPPGLTVNPLATDQCPIADFKADACPAGSKVGREEVTVSVKIGGVIPKPSPPFPPGEFFPENAVLPPSTNPALNTLVDVYNIVPEFGEAARFGFKIGSAKSEVYLEGDVDWAGDYHQGFTIVLPPPNPAAHTLKSRLVNFGKSGEGSYISNPTTCIDPATGIYTTFLRADSVAEPDPDFPVGQTPWPAALPPGVEQEDCDTVPFDPTLVVAPGTNQIDSPAAPEVTVNLPYNPDENGQEQSHVRDASVTLPQGMALNPSAAAAGKGLESCTTQQFGKGTENPVTCPAGSKIGTASVETPPLEPGSLVGDVYLGQQIGSNPESGEMYRIFINPKSDRYDIDVRLIGNVKANKETGQLVTTLLENPQVPFESVSLKLDGSKETLTSPPTCATQTSTTSQEPWARLGTFVTKSADFTLTSDPAGGSCPTSLAARKFTPSYTAKSDSTKAGAYSPFRVRIARVDGEQELKVVDVTLPKGLTGKLAGIPYCSEAAIAAAAASTGAAELANPSCSSASRIGSTSTDSGTGPKPLNIGGNAYLAGPYKGAPLSMVVITPAKAGPFDLGVVVVRVALNVNPATAQINAVSDAVPDVFGGAKLDIRLIDVNVDRPQFMLNPTNCAAGATAGTIAGGGSGQSPLSSYAVSAPYQATECNKLAFKPKLFTRLFGPTKRAKNPRIRAILEARNGDANMARTALTMPRSLFLDQSHIKTICTRPQLASMTCPKASVYGQAEAKSPLLDNKLKGPVYLVASDDKLPNLVADLRGQVRIQLRGVISSKRGGLKTVFPEVPDVPVKKFILNMKGGKKSLLVNSQNLCAKKQKAVLNMKAQNGKKVKNNKYGLRISSCGKKKK